MKRLLFMLLCSVCMFCKAENTLKTGDIIFQISKSNQSKAIAYATMSPWTHCGVIVYKNSKPYVLEASNVVKLTPLNDFINKGLGRIYSVYRYTDESVSISYDQYLSRKYDSSFSWNNNLYYCSELVWKIYNNQLNVTLCTPQPLSFYNTLGLSKMIKRRNISDKSVFVAPVDLVHSKLLKKIL